MTFMKERVKELKGANIDIDLASPKGTIKWEQDACPWNCAEGTGKHRCATKNVSICKYFRGLKPKDIVLCAYPKK